MHNCDFFMALQLRLKLFRAVDVVTRREHIVKNTLNILPIEYLFSIILFLNFYMQNDEKN